MSLVRCNFTLKLDFLDTLLKNSIVKGSIVKGSIVKWLSRVYNVGNRLDCLRNGNVCVCTFLAVVLVRFISFTW